MFKKVSTRIELPDGRKVFEKNINDKPEDFYTDEIMKKLELAVAKEFKYGSAVGEDETEILGVVDESRCGKTLVNLQSKFARVSMMMSSINTEMLVKRNQRRMSFVF